MLRHTRPFPRFLFAGLILALVAVFAFLMLPRSVSGDEFKAIFDETGKSSDTAWVLYSRSESENCFKLSRAVLPPARYCVATSDLVIRGGDSGPRSIFKGDLQLQANRYPDARSRSTKR